MELETVLYRVEGNVGIVSLMRQCTAYAVRFSHNSDHWFSPVLAKHFFD